MTKRCIFVMGVSGSGKTTVGQIISAQIGARLVDADQYHSARSKAMMAAGVPLSDDDRKPWLNYLAQLAGSSNETLVMACSALKQAYRRILTSHLEATQYVFVYLRVSRQNLEKRLITRKGHFFHSRLLDNQLSTLEEPINEENSFTIDADKSIEDTVQNVLYVLK